MSDFAVQIIGVAALIVVYTLLRYLRPLARGRGQTGKGRTSLDPDKFIVVDGSNVMHWAGEPSALTVNRVLVALQKAGLTPIIYFDANVGYKLWGRYADARYVAPRIGIGANRVTIVPKGVTADELLLKFATGSGLRVVTNDRFMDWRAQFPKIRNKGFLVKGEIRGGKVFLRGL